jgi:hypothetical protein
MTTMPATIDHGLPSALQPVREEVEKFIRALTGSTDSVVTFQTFADPKELKDEKSLRRVLHGPLAVHWEELVNLNKRSAGIFVMVNEGDGVIHEGEKTCRCEKSVRALRALFADDDTGKLTPAALPLPPSMLVQSCHGLHPYWLLRPGEPLARFREAQQAIASALGTDSKVNDLPRVLRVPGFFHLKDPAAPFLVRVLEAKDVRYTIDEVLRALPKAPSPQKPSVVVVSAQPTAQEKPTPPPDGDRSALLEQARRFLEKQEPAVDIEHGGGGGDNSTFVVCCTLVKNIGLTAEEAFEVLQPWNERCTPPWSPESLRQKIANAQEYGKDEPGFPEETRLASQYIFVRNQDRYFCRATGDMLGRGALNSSHARTLNENTFEVPTGPGTRGRTRFMSALVDNFGTHADDLSWWPGKPELYEYLDRTLVNSFRPPPAPDLAAHEPTPWLEHLRWLLPKQVEHEHLLDVLGYLVQQLGGKCNHAVVIGGALGIGKDMLLMPLRLWLASAWKDAKSEELDRPFNEYLYRAKVLCVQESRDLSFDLGFHRYNSLKTVIASPPEDLTLNLKFLREIRVPNLVQVIMLTNFENGVFFEERDDRRYFVAWSHVEKNKPEYYASLAAWIDEHFMDVVGYLARRNLEHFNPKAPPPDTEARANMHEATRSSAELMLVEVAFELIKRQHAFVWKELEAAAKQEQHQELLKLLGNRVRAGGLLRKKGFSVGKTRDGDSVYWREDDLPSWDDARDRFNAMKKARLSLPRQTSFEDDDDER